MTSVQNRSWICATLLNHDHVHLNSCSVRDESVNCLAWADAVGFWSIVETFGTFVQLLTRPSWRPLVQEMVANAKIFEDQSGSKSRIVILITPGLFFGCFSGNMGLFCFRNIEFWTNVLGFLIKICWVLKFCSVNEDCLSFQRSVIWVFTVKIVGMDKF